MINRFALAILFNAVAFTSVIACQQDVQEPLAKRSTATTFPKQFTKEEMKALANDKENNKTQHGLIVFKLDPKDKDQFMSYYNAGWVRRWVNGGAAAYFLWQADKQPGSVATYKFSSTYSNETANIDIIREYDVFKSLEPTKCVVRDGALCLYRLWQFDDLFLQDKRDARMNLSLANMCYLRDAYAFDQISLTNDSDEIKERKGFKAYIQELRNHDVDEVTIEKIMNGTNVAVDVAKIQKVTRTIKHGLFIALGVNPELLDQQMRAAGELQLAQDFAEYQVKIASN